MFGGMKQMFWKWWKSKKQSVSQNKGKATIFLVILVAISGILVNQFQQQFKRKEHKCKRPQPKPPEPPSLRYPPDIEIPLPPSPSVLHVFQHAAVCSDSEICSRVGRDILQQGGNAVDSALATLACNGLVTMQSMGIGGGFIMNFYRYSMNHSSTVIARETAPAAINEDQFFSKANKIDSNLQGPLSIAVPGEVMGYAVAHQKFGSLPWKRILQPTVDICEKGFQLSKHQWDSLFFNPRVQNDEFLREMFVNKSVGGYNRVGSLVHPPRQLCETYRILATKGPREFYSGHLAEMIADDLRDIGSKISLNDLKNYHAEVLDSFRLKLGSDVLHLVPPVGSGVVVGQAMNILKGYNFDKLKYENETIMIHRIVEALKFGFASRWKFGDPDFNSQKNILAEMLSRESAENLRLKINDTVTYSDTFHYGGESSPVNEHGTGHLSVLAPNGDAVSVTSTIHYYFGSAIMGIRTGILFNSAMGDFSIPGLENYFSLPPSKANLIQPNKRPMSSMAPTIVTTPKGDVKIVLGGAGGPKIISALVNILVRMLWLGKDIKEAIDAPRFHHQLVPDFFEYEFGMLKHVVDDLETIGHKTLRYRERGSVFCGIMKNETAIYANADFRKLGGVFGF